MGGGTARAAAPDIPAAELEAATEDVECAATVSLLPCVASVELKAILSTPNVTPSSEASLR